MPGSNYCFLTCIQISQEAGKVVCYSHLLKNFPQFVVIHTVKGFSIASEAEVDVFLEFSCFICDPTNSLCAQSACNAGDLGSILGLGRSPGEGNGNHFSILAWITPWTEDPGFDPWVRKIPWRRTWQSTSVFLLG